EGWQPSSVHPDFRSSTRGSAVFQAIQDYFSDLRKGLVSAQPILIMLLDGNCHGANKRKKEVLTRAARYQLSPDQLLIEVPDRHIERWFLDEKALRAAVDDAIVVDMPVYKCQRAYYKNALRKAFRAADIFPLAGGVEYAADIMPHLMLDRPSCSD